MSEYKTVLELLSVEERWTKNALAKDINNKPMSANESEACKWCLVGACQAVYGRFTDECRSAIEKLEKAINNEGLGVTVDFSTWDFDGMSAYKVSFFNNSSTHKDLLNVIKLAKV